jgi:hypothetical protein
MFKITFIILISLLSLSCNNNNDTIESRKEIKVEQNNFNGDDFDENIENIPDDTYAATVDYYNPNTGTSSTYTLNVEVVDNCVRVIHFNNGGWLDETHIISGGELNEDGSTEIESDKGYIYTVTIDR